MNTRNGYVFIGVADDLTIVGIENELAEHFNNSLDLMKRSLIDKLAHESNKISNIYTHTRRNTDSRKNHIGL